MIVRREAERKVQSSETTTGAGRRGRAGERKRAGGGHAKWREERYFTVRGRAWERKGRIEIDGGANREVVIQVHAYVSDGTRKRGQDLVDGMVT